MRRVVSLLLLLLPCGPAFAERYAVSGGEIQVRLALDWDTIQVGEPVYASLSVVNETTKAIAFEDGSSRNPTGRPEHVRLTVTPSGGEALPIRDAGPSFGGIWGVVPLEPGERKTTRLLLPDWVRITAAGTYTITASRTYAIHDVPEANGAPPSGQIEASVSATLTVLPFATERVPAILERLARRLRGENYDEAHEAVEALAYVEDPRAILPLDWAVGYGDYGLRLPALTALAKFPDDLALATIRHGLEAKEEEFRKQATTLEGAQSLAKNVRIAAAAALAKSVHPDAFDALLGLEGDALPDLRLILVHALGRRHTASDLEVLRRLQGDDAPRVAGEAKRYLAAGAPK